MNKLRRKRSALTFFGPLVPLLVLPSLANAHLMPAQRGTLNILDGAVFMVLSLPVSAFHAVGLDEDGDGTFSPREVDDHRGPILDAVKHNVVLVDSQGRAELVGVMLSFGDSHGHVVDSISQVTVVGRFNMNAFARPLRFEVGLYGLQAQEQVLEITAARKRDKRKTTFELTPATPVGHIGFNSYTF